MKMSNFSNELDNVSEKEVEENSPTNAKHQQRHNRVVHKPVAKKARRVIKKEQDEVTSNKFEESLHEQTSNRDIFFSPQVMFSKSQLDSKVTSYIKTKYEFKKMSSLKNQKSGMVLTNNFNYYNIKNGLFVPNVSNQFKIMSNRNHVREGYTEDEEHPIVDIKGYFKSPDLCKADNLNTKLFSTSDRASANLKDSKISKNINSTNVIRSPAKNAPQMKINSNYV